MNKKIEVITDTTKKEYKYCDYEFEEGFLIIKREQEIEANGFVYPKFYECYNLQKVVSFYVETIDK